MPEKVFQARQVSILGSKRGDVHDHVSSPSTPIGTVPISFTRENKPLIKQIKHYLPLTSGTISKTDEK